MEPASWQLICPVFGQTTLWIGFNAAAHTTKFACVAPGKKYFDVEPYIQGEWYRKLRILEYFKKVTTDGFTVVWPDGQDICPDELYDLGKLVS